MVANALFTGSSGSIVSSGSSERPTRGPFLETLLSHAHQLIILFLNFILNLRNFLIIKSIMVLISRSAPLALQHVLGTLTPLQPMVKGGRGTESLGLVHIDMHADIAQALAAAKHFSAAAAAAGHAGGVAVIGGSYCGYWRLRIYKLFYSLILVHRVCEIAVFVVLCCWPFGLGTGAVWCIVNTKRTTITNSIP